MRLRRTQWKSGTCYARPIYLRQRELRSIREDLSTTTMRRRYHMPCGGTSGTLGVLLPVLALALAVAVLVVPLVVPLSLKDAVLPGSLGVAPALDALPDPPVVAPTLALVLLCATETTIVYICHTGCYSLWNLLLMRRWSTGRRIWSAARCSSPY